MSHKCNHSGCEVEIQDTWEQKSGKGFIYWVDTSTKQRPFVHRHNLPDFGGGDVTAARKLLGRNGDSELAGLVLAEMVELGASEASMAIARRLATMASEGKGSPAAVQSLDRLAARLGEAWAVMRPPQEDSEPCKLCGRVATGAVEVHLSDGPSAQFRELLDLDDEDISQS